jgi:hypothetical protein
MDRDEVLNLRVPADLKEALRRAADDDHGRSMSAMAVRILREWLTAGGYISTDGKRSKAKEKR